MTSGILPKNFVDVEKDEVHLTLKEKMPKRGKGHKHTQTLLSPFDKVCQWI